MHVKEFPHPLFFCFIHKIRYETQFNVLLRFDLPHFKIASRFRAVFSFDKSFTLNVILAAGICSCNSIRISKGCIEISTIERHVYGNRYSALICMIPAGGKSRRSWIHLFGEFLLHGEFFAVQIDHFLYQFFPYFRHFLSIQHSKVWVNAMIFCVPKYLKHWIDWNISNIRFRQFHSESSINTQSDQLFDYFVCFQGVHVFSCSWFFLHILLNQTEMKVRKLFRTKKS